MSKYPDNVHAALENLLALRKELRFLRSEQKRIENEITSNMRKEFMLQGKYEDALRKEELK